MSPVLVERGTRTDTQSATSLPLRLALAGTCAFVAAAPSLFCNHAPTDYNYWPQSLALLGLCAVALCLALSPVAWPKFSGVSALLTLFLGWNLLAVWTGVYRHDAWLELARLTGAAFLYFALRALRPRLVTIALWAVAGAGVPALGALIDYSITHNARQQGGFFPYTLGFLNANLFAAMLAPALMLSVLAPLEAWRLTRKSAFVALACAPCVAIALALALSSSKGGFVAALAASLVLLLALFRARGAAMKRGLRRAWPMLLVVGVIFGAVAVKTVGTRISRAGGKDDNSTQFRLYAWRATANMAAARPLVGFGPGAFPTVYPRFALVGYTRTAHQSWLQIAAESGWPSLLLLLGAFGMAVRSGWRGLQAPDFAPAACGLAALCAVLVHGFFDSGWSILPVVALAVLALALCDAGDETPASTERRGLNLPFLGATLLLLLGGYGTQRVAGGEDLRAAAEYNVRRGLPQSTAFDAVEADAGSARSWNLLARVTPIENREAWTRDLLTATRLQPDSAAHPRDLARQLDALPAPTNADLKQIAALYDRAVELDPLNSSLRLERAAWRLAHKDGRGHDDLGFVLREWDAPFGKYPALGRDDDVNLDFARATLAMAPRLKHQGQEVRAKLLTRRALADCALAHQLLRDHPPSPDAPQSVRNFKDLDELERGLRALL